MVIPESTSDMIARIARESGKGSGQTAVFNSIYGFNHRRPGVSPAPLNQEVSGAVFMTKPTLNLAYNNISVHRKLEFLGDPNPASMGAAIKCMLSPYIDNKRIIPRDDTRYLTYDGEIDNVRSLIVDDRNPFIPLLSNTLISLTGWQDKNLDVFTTEEGLYKESMSWVDGRPHLYGTTDFTAVFKAIQGDPTFSLIDVWTEYAGLVAAGDVFAYPEYRISKSIDYTTRFYNFTFDKSKRFIQKMACVGAAFPTALNTGAYFNHNSESFFKEDIDVVSVPFRVIGMMYNDPIIAKWFNATVQLTNPYMTDENRDKYMVRLDVDPDAVSYFNWRGYPHIETSGGKDSRLYEMVWYYYRADVEAFLNGA